MSIETQNNFSLKRAAALDARLDSVQLYSNLLDPNLPASWLVEGAQVYVKSEKAYYRVENNGTTLVWVKQTNDSLALGTIIVTPTTTQLDLSLCTPEIAKCDGVKIEVSGGTEATFQTILNFPAGDEIMFYVKTGQKIIFKHTEYSAANNGAIVLEDGQDMTIEGRTVGNEMLWLKQEGTAAVQKGAVQFVRAQDWANQVLTLQVDDNLTSDNVNRALSSRQGRILNETKQQKITFDQNTRLQFDEATSILSLAPNAVGQINATWTTQTLTDLYAAATANNIPSFLITIPGMAIYSNVDRHVNLNYSTAGNNVDRPVNFGIWLLPANSSAILQTSWVKIEDKKNLYSVQYKTFQYTTNLEGDSNSMFKSIPMQLNTAIGELNSFMEFNALGAVNDYFTFKPKYATTADIYEIECVLNFRKTSLLNQPIILSLYETTVGLIPVTSINFIPPNSSVIAMSSNYNNASDSATSYLQLAIRTRVKPNAGGTIKGYGFVLSCPELVNNFSFAGMTLEKDTSSIRLTKIS